MNFGEKVANARKKKNLTQAELASAIGVSQRTIQNYENNVRPRMLQTYYDLAEVLGIDVNYLLTADESFVLEAKEQFGYTGAAQAENLIANAGALFAGGDISEEEKEKVFAALQEVYFEAKYRNKEKYGKRD